MVRARVCAALLLLITGCLPHGGESQRKRVPLGAGPVLAVSLTGGNKIAFIALDEVEHLIETISVPCKGPFGLSFSADRRWLYTACWDNSQVALVDLQFDRTPHVFRGAKQPAWMRLRDPGREMWTSNEGAGKVTIYRSGGATILGEIATGVGPSDIVFTDDGRRAWVSNETSGTVSLIDAERRTKLQDITVGKTPQGMALTAKKDRLLVANFGSNTVSIIDTALPHELAQIPVCQGPVEVTTATNGVSELGYVSCFKSGEVLVFDVNQRREVERIPVGDQPFGMATHPAGDRVYACVGKANDLVVLRSGDKTRIARRIHLGGNPLRIAIAP
jgi:YVTN family beta-propeller protein